MDANKKTEKSIKLSAILISLAALIVFYIIIIGCLIYFFGLNNNLAKKTARVVPYPAAVSAAGFISYNKLEGQLDSARKFYENQDFSKLGMRVDFSTPDGIKRLKIKEKNILNKLIENLVIEAEAKKRGINLTPDMIDQAVDRKLKEYGTRDSLRDNMEKLYGWDLEDFKENIVKPDMYKEELFNALKKNDSSYAEAKDKINQAKSDLDGGKSFEETAKKYSEGESAESGGNLGWFSANQMLAEVALAVINLEKWQASEIIESPIGYHIVKLTDKKTEDGITMFQVSQIFIRTKSFAEYLAEMEKNRKIFIPLRDLKWNSDSGAVEFENSEMRDFEDNLLKNVSDDPSVLF